MLDLLNLAVTTRRLPSFNVCGDFSVEVSLEEEFSLKFDDRK